MEYVCVHTQVVHALILIHDTSVWTHELYLAMRNTEYIHAHKYIRYRVAIFLQYTSDRCTKKIMNIHFLKYILTLNIVRTSTSTLWYLKYLVLYYSTRHVLPVL